ncbi:MAG: molybdate transport system substrate-binding protein [Bermanella sp.]|jgi:molybdate transport system substrate-binding protein
MPYPVTQCLTAVARYKAGHNLASGVLLTLWLAVAASPVFAERLTVAVASNFSAPMRDIGKAFELESDHSVRFAFGSSGKLASQILQGAPFAAFFSADQSKPALLIEKGVASQSSQFTYAIGRLALWSADAEVDPIVLLRGDSYRKLALANPKLAPYGQAAVDVLESLKLAHISRAKWVQGENIAQTYQFVDSANAELGFVAYAQIYRGGQLAKGSVWLVPSTLHTAIRQDAVLLGAKPSVAASQFMHFMRSPQVKTILAGYGYQSDSEAGVESDEIEQ